MPTPTPPPPNRPLIEALKAFHEKMNLKRLTEGWSQAPSPGSPSRNLDEIQQLKTLDRTP